MESGAVDNMLCGNVSAGGLDVDAVVGAGHALDLSVAHQVSAALAHLGGVRLRHLLEVDDSGVGRPDGLNSGGVRLKLSQSLRPDQFQTESAVGSASTIQFLQTRNLGVVDSDNQLAAHFVLDAPLVAKLAKDAIAFGAEIGLLRAGGVVDARVDDSAVVTGLVLGDLGLLLDNHNLLVGVLLSETHGRSQTDDASADDADVIVTRVHVSLFFRQSVVAVIKNDQAVLRRILPLVDKKIIIQADLDSMIR